MDISRIAVVSRLLVFGLQVLFNGLIPDHNANAFLTVKPTQKTFGDKLISPLLSGYSRWDAQYYIHISLYGYTYENTLAFFPLFPKALSILTYPLQALFGSTVSNFNITLLSSSTLNFILFIATCHCLYRLTLNIFNDTIIANLSVLFFCINPASIFFSSCYSETLFSFLTFSTLLCLEKDRPFLAALICGLSTATRSNGIVSVPFIAHHELKKFINTFRNAVDSFTAATALIKFVFQQITYISVAIAPFIAYQIYAYILYCKGHQWNDQIPKAVSDKAILMQYKTYRSEEKSTWCSYKLPLSYSYIQAFYWDVGFMNYYELKQIPNFILAFPILLLTTSKIYAFFKMNFKRTMYLGLIYSDKLSDKLFVYIIHLTSLVITCVFFMHIQVSTRFLASSSPVIYWFIAAGARPFVNKNKIPLSSISDCAQCIYALSKTNTFLSFYVLHFVGYFVFGTALHANFLPWT